MRNMLNEILFCSTTDTTKARSFVKGLEKQEIFLFTALGRDFGIQTEKIRKRERDLQYLCKSGTDRNGRGILCGAYG